MAGATGWTGSAVARAIVNAPDLELSAAVARSTAGADLGSILGLDECGPCIDGTVSDALHHADVLVDYTAPEAAREHALLAVSRGVHVVMGTSGLNARDYSVIEHAAAQNGVGVIAAGNFALTAALLQAAAQMAARYLPNWEIIDYASDAKRDAPSGTTMELAEKLAHATRSAPSVDVEDTLGHPEARGADIAGTRVHSIRLPGFVLAAEVVFGLAGERLTMRHEAGASAEPYVAGTLLAIRAVPRTIGLIRGLDALLLRE